jgi:hypothetical protein
MTIEEIYEEYTPGSVGFVKAVQTHYAFDLSEAEIERIATHPDVRNADDFDRHVDDNDWWEDENQGRSAEGEES